MASGNLQLRCPGCDKPTSNHDICTTCLAECEAAESFRPRTLREHRALARAQRHTLIFG